MAIAFGVDDLVLLGYEEIKEVDVGSEAICISGVARAGIVRSTHTFVYLKSDLSRDDLHRLKTRIGSKSEVYFLRSKSGPSEQVIRSVFLDASGVYQIDDLLWARVSELFSSYALSLADSVPSEPHFIAPRGDSVNAKDRLDDFLVEYFTKSGPGQPERKNLVVLKAAAGVGKTTLCREIVRRFARQVTSHRIIPVYVEAAHWGARVNSTSDLWEIIQLSLQNFDSGSGISRALFEAALRRGLLLFVFDGFDELCSNPRANISAKDAVDALMRIAQDSDAKIVITTRTPYWDSEIGDDQSSIRSVDLLPFNSQQAKQYIRKFFEKDNALFEAARQLYSDVIRHAENPDTQGGSRAQFWTLPIAVSMICEAVKAGVSRSDWQTFSVEGLLTALCEREAKRQGLVATGTRQVDVFKEVALLEPVGTDLIFSSDDLRAAGIPDVDVPKFISHPLVRVVEEGQYRFAYDFLGPFLRALAIAEVMRSEQGVAARKPIVDAMSAEGNGKGFLIEHLTHLVDRDLAVVARLVQSLSPAEVSARSFAAHLLLRVADSQSDVVGSRDRTEVLLRAIGGSSTATAIRNFCFIGGLSRLDFSDVEFYGCEFRDVGFKDVGFKGAQFNACVFDGDITFASSKDEDGFASAKGLKDCEYRGGARVALEPLLRRDPNERSELLKDLLEAALSKFWHNGRFKATVRRADWSKGVLGRSGSSSLLLDILQRNGVLSEATISGVQEGGLVFDRRCIGDLQNFMDHRQMTGAILASFKDLEAAMLR